jgi:hypothetical protein
MPFDDILRRSLDALARDLSSAVQAERDDASRRAKDVADESVAAAITDAQAVAEQRGMMAGREEGLAEGRRQGFNQGRQEGYDAGKSDGYRIGKEEGFLAGKGAGANADAADQASGERLADAMRAIDRSRSLSEILDTLASCAGRETTRAAVFLVREGQLQGWRFIGFGPDFDRASAFEAPLTDAGILNDAVRTESAISTDSSAPGAAPRFAEVGPGCEIIAAPVLVGGRVVAALYAVVRNRREVAPHARLAASARGDGAACRTLPEGIGGSRRAALTDSPRRSVERDGPVDGPATGGGAPPPGLVSEIRPITRRMCYGRRGRSRDAGGERSPDPVLCEQRVPAEVRAGVDFFRGELVRTLAEGDEELL